MSPFNLLMLVAGVIAALIGVALTADFMGGFADREGNPPGYGVGPTETTPQPTQP